MVNPNAILRNLFFALPLLFAATGCVDAKQEFEDWRDRTDNTRGKAGVMPVPTGSSGGGGIDRGDGGLGAGFVPDGGVSGQFYVACMTTLASDNVDRALAYRATVNLDAQKAKIDVTLEPLRGWDKTAVAAFPATDTSQVVGQGLAAPTADVSADGRFTLLYPTLSVSGEANPISGSNIEMANASIDAVVKSTDKMCGRITGHVIKPADMALNDPTDICLFLRTTGPVPKLTLTDFNCQK